MVFRILFFTLLCSFGLSGCLQSHFNVEKNSFSLGDLARPAQNLFKFASSSEQFSRKKSLFFPVKALCTYPLIATAKGVDSSSFQQTIKEGTTLVDFYASWCGPCQQLGPIIDEVATEMKGKVNVVKLNVDKSSDLVQEYGIKGVPTLILFKNGKEVGRLEGYNDKDTIMQFIQSRS